MATIRKGIDFTLILKRIKRTDEYHIGLFEFRVLLALPKHIQINHRLIIPAALRQPPIGPVRRLNFNINQNTFIRLYEQVKTDSFLSRLCSMTFSAMG